MKQIIIPEGYSTKLGTYDTQRAIGMLKRTFEKNLCRRLHLKRVSAPLFVNADSGLNDNLNGVERPVSFDIKEHSTDEHSTLIAYFSTRKNVSVEYFDDNTSAYVSGTFRIVDFVWANKNALANKIDYDKTSITLEEY